ncbi:hypothetical protein B5M09_012844 [Aphanomyces astaci]|uniref:CCHC-type domain-containing protein n=1 Tax=Aphanomyces astaci TaxID=112090 RepID=A0A425C184_APHAT|nr:hypothetical protein B5M09_012844 [Aphanomyces astaci]
MSKLEWSERMGLESFNDQFHEFMRKMAAAGDMTPESSYITRYLCLLLPHFANTMMFITHEARTNTRYSSLPTILAELKLDDERQQMHGPNLRRNASRSDDALNTTSGECYYCGKAGHYPPECHRRQADEAKGIRRRSVKKMTDLTVQATANPTEVVVVEMDVEVDVVAGKTAQDNANGAALTKATTHTITTMTTSS